MKGIRRPSTRIVRLIDGIYHEGKLCRHGERSDFPIRELLEGVRRRDGEMIRNVLRAAFEQTVRG